MSKLKLNSIILGIMFILCIFIYTMDLSMADGNLRIIFLDVGQGDSVLIKTPNNKKILYDGGPNTNILSVIGRYIPFYDKNIDLLILSHPHSDHMDGLIHILNRYNVKNVMYVDIDFNDKKFDEFKNLSSYTNIIKYDKNKDIIIDGVILDFIAPVNIKKDEYKEKELNNTSLCLKVIYGGTTVFLTGDIEKDAENEIIKSGLDIQSDILKVAHHGSKTSSNNNILYFIEPSVAVIQAGYRNQYYFPHTDTINRLTQYTDYYYVTGVDGSIEFVCNSNNVCELFFNQN